MFKYEEGCYYMRVELPNDGTPDSDRFLELCVSPEEDRTLALDINIVYPKLNKYKWLANQPLTLEQASELLYPVARIKTIKVLEPTGK